jgi:hypothetical protein
MESNKTGYMPFTRMNYIIMIVGAVVLALGFILMTMDTEPYGFGFLGLTLAPIVILTGFVIEIFALLYKPKAKQ